MSSSTVSRAGWRLLTGDLAKRRRPLAVLAVWSVVESLPALMSGFAVAAALDHGFLAGRPLVGVGWLSVLGLAMTVQSLAVRNAFPHLAAVVEPVRDALVRTVAEGALRRAAAGERTDSAVVARVSGQTETVRNLVAALLRMLRPNATALVFALAGLAALAPVVAAVTVPLVLLSLGLFVRLTRILAVRQREVILAEEAAARVATDVFTGVRDVVAAGAVDAARETVDRRLAAKARASLRLARASSARSLVVALGGGVPLIVVLVLAPELLRSGRLTSGELVGAATYLVGTLDPALRALTGTVAAWLRQLGVLLHRIAETGQPPAPAVRPAGPKAERPPGPKAERPAGPKAARPLSTSLHLDRVTFAYGPHAEPVLDALTLHVPDGEHLAVVGPSGTGKSTLAGLLAGLADPQSGTVSIGDVPLARIDPVVLRRFVALIPQEAYVFTASLGENLRYLEPDATVRDLDRAVAALGMRALVDRIGGYDAPVGIDGAALSAGERQLIALARVYLSTAAVVVLDEATCHLDPDAEARVEEAFAATGRTLVVVAHRISSARRAGRILLLDGGTAIAGTHDELVAVSPMYADLVGNWDRRPTALAAGHA